MRYGLLVLALLLAGCVSSVMRPYVGKPIEDAMIDFGRPEQVIDLQDGRKAFQFRYAAGSYTTPGTSYSTVTGYGNTATVSTVSTPATVYETAGCLLTFIAANRGNGWVIEEYRVPKGLVC